MHGAAAAQPVARAQAVPDLYKHMLAVSYQLEAALEGLALAHALNRTVVFPKLWCWCDFDWYAVVLDGCAMGGRPGVSGADLYEMPFECPIDVIMEAAALYRHSGAYRQERFLQHPRTPGALARSREAVLVIDGRDTAQMQARQRMVRRPSPRLPRVSKCMLVLGSQRLRYSGTSVKVSTETRE